VHQSTILKYYISSEASLSDLTSCKLIGKTLITRNYEKKKKRIECEFVINQDKFQYFRHKSIFSDHDELLHMDSIYIHV